ncbi:MAG TPA: amidase [Acidimicrobiales bacterium]|nr:amidase [Acidimicrobiales bacterium]
MELHELSALELADALRRREVSPSEVVEHHLRRIDEHGARIGAFVTVSEGEARAAAAQAERALLEGRADAPLLGVPTAIKDLNLTAGVRTTFGSALGASFVPSVDDHVVTLLREAGLISLGKTNTPEFGLCCYTEPEVAPPARCPYDLARSAGGSSGGAGAAVAARLVPLAQGSDGAGSVRIPASACGVVGLKPARGRVSNGPLGSDVGGLAVNGVLARTVADAAAALDAMAVPMPGDPCWAPPLPPGERFLDATRRETGRLRIGRFLEPVIAEAAVDPECVRAYEVASSLLESLGHEVEDCPRPLPSEVTASFEVVWSVGAAAIPVPPGGDDLLRPITRWLRGRGRAVDAPSFVRAVAELQLAARRAIVATAAFDALLTPTLAQRPALVGALRDDEDPAADFEAQKRFTPFSAMANLTGQPAISLPLHWSEDGLPIGVQLVGPSAGEARLLSLAAQLEAAAPWHARAPEGF